MFPGNSLQFYLWVLLAGTLTFSLACSSSKPVKMSPQTDRGLAGFDKMNEDFDPHAVVDYDLDIEDVGGSQPDPQRDYLSQQTLEDSVGMGYRVQLLQTIDPEEAKNVQREAILRFDEAVYRVFNAPFYKVRIGDLVNWSDAERLQKLAIQKGFKESWIIQTQVNLKKAYQWMEEL